MTKKNIIRPVSILLLSAAFLAGCTNQGHHGTSGGHGSGHGGGHSDGGHSSSQSGGHGTTVIEDEAHPTH